MARIRGVASLSAICGAIGAVLGAGWTALTNLMTWGGIFGYSITQGAIFWGVLTALSTGGFGVVLIALGGRRSLDEIPLWKAALWGAIGGAGILLTIVSVLNGAVPRLAAALPMLAFSGALGGLLGSGLIAVAKAAPSEQVRAGPDDPAALDEGR